MLSGDASLKTNFLSTLNNSTIFNFGNPQAQKQEELSNSFEVIEYPQDLAQCVLIQPDKAVMKGNWQSLYPYCHLMVTNTTYRQLPAAKTKRILCTSVTAAVFQHSHACQYVKTEVYLISKNTFLGNSENHECQKYLQNIIA